MTNIKMHYKWLPTAPGVCVCTLDGLNAEHKFRVYHVTFSHGRKSRGGWMDMSPPSEGCPPQKKFSSSLKKITLYCEKYMYVYLK